MNNLNVPQLAAEVQRSERPAPRVGRDTRQTPQQNVRPVSTILGAVVVGDIHTLRYLCSIHKRNTDEDSFAFLLAQKSENFEAVEILQAAGIGGNRMPDHPITDVSVDQLIDY